MELISTLEAALSSIEFMRIIDEIIQQKRKVALLHIGVINKNYGPKAFPSQKLVELPRI